jgi:acyl carrier protein
VWLTLKGIIVDQLQVSEENVKEEAAFQRELGCD